MVEMNNINLNNVISHNSFFFRDQIENNQNENNYIQDFHSYDNLPKLSSEHISLFTIRKITTILSLKGIKWEEIFNCITQLRILHKNYPKLFYKIFNFCYKNIESKIFEINQKISINIVLLLSEIFSKKYNENTNEFYYQLNYLKVFYDKIIRNCVSFNNIINGRLKMQCIVCLSNISFCLNSYQALLVILKYLINNEKNFLISDKTFTLIVEIIKNIDYQNLLNQNNYQPLCKFIINLFFVKKLNYQKYSFLLIQMLKEKNLNLFEKTLNENDIKFLKMIEEYGINHDKKKDFSISLKKIQKDKLEHLCGMKKINKENYFNYTNV
jgi:hypothetical protein